MLGIWSLERDSPITQLINLLHPDLACGDGTVIKMWTAGENVMDRELVITATEGVFC